MHAMPGFRITCVCNLAALKDRSVRFKGGFGDASFGEAVLVLDSVYGLPVWVWGAGGRGLRVCLCVRFRSFLLPRFGFGLEDLRA